MKTLHKQTMIIIYGNLIAQDKIDCIKGIQDPRFNS